MRNTKYAIRNTLFAIAALFAVLLSGVQSARAFSFWGPKEAYQVANVGYNRLYFVDYPGAVGWVLIADEPTFAPHNLGEEFRWNVPNLFYAYDPTFVEYFGSNGVRAVDAAAGLMNALPRASEMDLNEFPLSEYRFNFTASALHLFDLKSAALELMVTRIGLADPEMFTWTLRSRASVPPACPAFTYEVIQRNFDPFNLQPSRFVNGNLFTYFIDQPCPPDVRGDRSEAVELKVNPADDVLTAVASPKITWPNINYRGMFHVGMTLDDAGGIRHLYHTNNINVEQAAPDVQLFQTNTAPVPLFSSNLTLFAAQALTNSAAALQALYPGLVITSSSNFYTVTQTTNVVSVLVPGPPWSPAGSFTLVTRTNLGPPTLQTNFVHTFANVVTFVFTNGQWTIQPMTTFPTGLQIVNFQTISIIVSNPPFLPAQDFGIFTITTDHLRVQTGPVGEFFIFPTNFCDVIVSSVAFTNVVPITNILSIATNTTVGTTNAGGGTNRFNGQVLFSQNNLITFFTNHLFIVIPVICTNDTIALRSGLDKISFIRHDYDPLLSRFFTPVTNDFTDVAETTNHIRYLEHFRRVVTRPDIIMTAADIGTDVAPETVDHTRTLPGFLTPSNSAPPIAVAGPGAFVGQMVFAFNKVGPIFLNENPGAGDEISAILQYIWGSFDGSTNNPIIYPDTVSIADIERAFAMTVSPQFLPLATVGQSYSATVTISGGQAPYTWTLSPQSLPMAPGLSFSQDPNDSSQGIISGIPTAAGTYPFTLQITDGTGFTVNAAEAVGVNP